MTVLEALGEIPALQSVGGMVLHSLWQGLLIGSVVGAALLALRNRSPNARYLAACTGLVAVVLVPIGTIALGGSFAAVAARMGLLLLVDRTVGLAMLIDWTPRVLPVVAASWLVGASLFLLRSSVQWYQLRQLLRRGVSAVTPNVTHAVRTLSTRLKLRRPVAVWQSAVATVPMVVGWARPVILIPTAALSGLTPEQLRAILAHELAHVRRHDYLVNVVQVVIESLMFYHPIVWWLSRRIRAEREYCCDDLAVAVGSDAVGYARALATLEETRDSDHAMAATGGVLFDRILRLVGQSPPRDRMPLTLPGLVLAGIFVLTLITSALTIASPGGPGTLFRLRQPAPAGQSLNLPSDSQRRPRTRKFQPPPGD